MGLEDPVGTPFSEEATPLADNDNLCAGALFQLDDEGVLHPDSSPAIPLNQVHEFVDDGARP